MRGIADSLYKNGGIPRKIESKDIYLGSIPWVVLQLILVVVVIFVPQTVTVFLDKQEKVDLDQVQLEVPVDDFQEMPKLDDQKMIDDLFKEPDKK